MIFLNKTLPRSEAPLENKGMNDWTIPRVIYTELTSERWEHCPKLLEDESFSSYFTRTAKANFAKPLGILRNLDLKRFRHFNEQNYVLDEIIDRNSLLLILQHLKLNDQDKKNILLSCDSPLHPLMTTEFGRFTKHTVKGTKYCPLCLKEDEIPYFRLYWRFSFITICFKHKQLLDEVCPHCNQPIKFWLTSWDSSLTNCYSCGNDICNTQNSMTKPSIKDLSIFDFQKQLFQLIFKKKVAAFRVNSARMITQLWKVGWFEAIDRDGWYSAFKRGDIWKFKIPKKNTIEKFRIVYSGFKTIINNPDRLTKPFNCLECEKLYSELKYFLAHQLTHLHLNCPIQECQGTDIRLSDNRLRCRDCGSIFLFDGTIILKKVPPSICPLDDCKGKDIRVKGDGYLCRLCRSEFTQEGFITKKGSTPPTKCPLSTCDGMDIRTNTSGFRCRTCGTEFSFTNKVIKMGTVSLKICPSSECNGSDIRRKYDYFLCYRCKTRFTSEGNIISLNQKPHCMICHSGYTRVNSSGIIKCRLCGSEFTHTGTILKKSEKYSKACPSCFSSKFSFRITSNNCLCRICGTCFEVDGTIIHKGS